MAHSVSLGTLGRSVPSGSHICTFYNGPAGLDEATPAGSYLRVPRVLHRRHVVIVDGMIHENPYYIEPAQFAGGTG